LLRSAAALESWTCVEGSSGANLSDVSAAHMWAHPCRKASKLMLPHYCSLLGAWTTVYSCLKTSWPLLSITGERHSWAAPRHAWRVAFPSMKALQDVSICLSRFRHGRPCVM
jgi:hypothetical protein